MARKKALVFFIVLTFSLLFVSRTVLAEQPDLFTSDGVPLTPEGNLTLVDDIQSQDEKDKQFITVKTRDDSMFFIVIDRSAQQDNVYFLNLVDDKDLIALLKDLEATKEIEELRQTAESPQANDEVESQAESVPPKSKAASQLPIIGILLLLVGGAIFWLVRFKPLQKNKDKGFAFAEYTNVDDETEELVFSKSTASYKEADEE